MNRSHGAANMPPTPKPLGKYRQALRPYLLSLAAVGVLAVIVLLSAPSLLVLLLLPVGGILALGGDRLREHAGWHRKGGKAALRKRRRYQGIATMGELARNLPAGQGVRIGTVRKAGW